MSVDGRDYCAVKKASEKTHWQAVSLCRSLNARLPLPKSYSESKAFYNAFPFSLWVDLTDLGMTGKKNNWKDSTGASPQYTQTIVANLVLIFLAFQR